MGSNFLNGASNGSARSSYTVTALGRWSIIDKQLPPVESIKTLHVYDFDNTLFKTPLPNSKLWNGQTIGALANPDIFVNGGWWHDSRILAATGEGAETEEKRAWSGWWNEKIVELVRLSTAQKDALCVLLTGRSEKGFTDLIKRIVKSKGLEFDMIGLKPSVGPSQERFSSTMHFKQLFLQALMETYKQATEIRIYEDRIRHVQGFRAFMQDYNRCQNGIGGTPTRDPIVAEVIQVFDVSTNLDPVVEVAEIQHLINMHNSAIAQNPAAGRKRPERLAIKKTVFFTGYMIEATDTKRLLTLANVPSNFPESEMKYHANNIMICPRPCPQTILDKVGGMGAKMKWEVTGTACFENSIWAASLKAVPPSAKFHTDNPSPFVVLALRRGARPVDAGKIKNWQPVPADKAYVFETTVGEKVLLRIESDNPEEDEYESLFPNKSSKRKHGADSDSDAHHGHRGGHRGGRGNRNFHSDHRGGRGGRGNFRGNKDQSRGYKGGARGGNSRGGRGGRGGYKSLDDLGGRDMSGTFGGNGQVSYDDSYPPLPQGNHGGFQQPQQPQHQQPPQPQYGQFQYQQPNYGNWQSQPQGPGNPGYGAGGPELYY